MPQIDHRVERVDSSVRRAIVFGKGRVAIRATQLLLDEGYSVPFVVPSIEQPPGRAFADWATMNGVAVRRVKSLDELTSVNVELGISVYYDKIFRQRHIDEFGMLLNVHNSPLPRYRGVRPVNWALKRGELMHGVSLHLITPGIDEGGVLDREMFAIDPEHDEVRDVYDRCLLAAEILLERALPKVNDLTPVAQNDADATYYSAADDHLLGNRRYWTRDATRLE